MRPVAGAGESAFAGFDAPMGGRPEEVLVIPSSTPRIVTKAFRLQGFTAALGRSVLYALCGALSFRG